MDRVAIILQTLKTRQEEAEKLSKKIYLGKFQNSTHDDVIVKFESPNGAKIIPLQVTSIPTIYYLNELIKLTQLKGKPNYLATITVEKLLPKDDQYKQMSFHVSLDYENKFFAVSVFPPIPYCQKSSGLELSMVNTPYGIIIDGEIAGDCFSDSKVACRAAKNDLRELK